MVPHKRIRLKIGALVGLTTSIVIIGMIFYHHVEHFDYIDALYFSVITLTTVGYGDFSPSTDIGKIFTIVYIIVGIGILMAFIDTLSQRLVASKMHHMAERQKERSDKDATIEMKEKQMAEYRAKISKIKADIDKESQK